MGAGPVVGFGTLEQPFFPPTTRDQVQIKLRRPQQSAIGRIEAKVLAVRDYIRRHHRDRLPAPDARSH